MATTAAKKKTKFYLLNDNVSYPEWMGVNVEWDEETMPLIFAQAGDLLSRRALSGRPTKKPYVLTVREVKYGTRGKKNQVTRTWNLRLVITRKDK